MNTGKKLLLGALCGIALLQAPALAGDYPVKPVRIIVPFGPGGANDMVARVLSEPLSADLGQAVIVENRPGASTIIGANVVARAEPDGYTLLLSGSSTYTVLPALSRSLPYDTLRDFDLLGVVADLPMVLVTNAAGPIQSAPQVLERARSEPGKLTYATYGTGSVTHLMGEIFSMVADVELSPVPYRGSAQAVLGVMGSEVDIAPDTLAATLPRIQSGHLRALASFGPRRVAQLPDVPTMAELGLPDATFSGWIAIALPKGTPPEVRQRLSRALEKAMASDPVRQALDKAAMLPVFLPEAPFKTRVEQEIGTFKKVAAQANIVLE
ncbi:tripartite tricarboxylate transporter substrate binding protein [Corticibacter populi]|uniref:Tripartite tricarboxylate transporter substrate binding protein n=1 Tax=Corticibacter populi TaxID=1550736 RepID=A0A3M6QV81_9BURK|nr:tripartite tricarboxylate transporter substrate binding protein [Corticibacter populi]RMX06918.1 tripartite tricarboxylate transporter substrate binding protein [Corticibacter populi]RZS31807.1 tripartite-type tricarboxylate transporter receptor subunit TctC [Corticibacter populi]